MISFVSDGVHPFDIGTLLDQYGIAVRTGHHYAQPLMDFIQFPEPFEHRFPFIIQEMKLIYLLRL